MNYDNIKTVPNLYEVTKPTATKSKDWGNGKVSYIIKGTNTNLTDSQLADLCGDYAHVVKIYRNTPTFAVVIVLKASASRPLYEVNRYGNIRPTGWAVRAMFGI